MIEEAAGTRMYESKKQQAIKTMEKKQSKLTEIDNVYNWLFYDYHLRSLLSSLNNNLKLYSNPYALKTIVLFQNNTNKRSYAEPNPRGSYKNCVIW